MKAKYSIIDIVYILLIKASCKKCTVHFTMGSKHTIQCTRLLTVTWHFSSSTNTWQLSHTIFIIRYVSLFLLGFPGGDTGKEPTCQCRRHKRLGFDPWVGKSPWRRAWQLTPVFLSGGSQGQRSLAGTVHRVTQSQIQLKKSSAWACSSFCLTPEFRGIFTYYKCL